MLYIFQAASNAIDNSLDEESEAGGDGCSGKMCTANEHCCDKHVCVDADESKFIGLQRYSYVSNDFSYFRVEVT